MNQYYYNWLIVIFILTIAVNGFTQDSTGIRRIGYVPTPAWATQCVKVRGDYCFIGAQYQVSFKVLDVSDPQEPVLLDSLARNGGGKDMELVGDIIYLANGNGILSIDISHPNQIAVISNYQGTDTPYLSFADDYIFLYDHWEGNHYSWIRIIDASNPRRLRLVGSLMTRGTNINDILARGDYLYITNHSYGVSIASIEDKQNPFIYHSFEFENPYDIAIQGDYSYIASQGGGLFIVEFTEPNSIRRIGQCEDPQNARAIFIQDQLCFLADWDAGLFIIDITNPAEPRTLANYPAVEGNHAMNLDVLGNLCFVAEAHGLAIYDISAFLSVQESETFVKNYALFPAYPNPFNSTTNIDYTLPFSGNVEILLCNSSGQQISTIFRGYKQPGVYKSILSAINLSTGLYFIRLNASNQIFTQNVMLIR